MIVKSSVRCCGHLHMLSPLICVTWPAALHAGIYADKRRTSSAAERLRLNRSPVFSRTFFNRHWAYPGIGHSLWIVRQSPTDICPRRLPPPCHVPARHRVGQSVHCQCDGSKIARKVQVASPIHLSPFLFPQPASCFYLRYHSYSGGRLP